MPQIRKELHGDRMISCYAERPRHVNAMLQGSFAQSADGLALVDGDARLSYLVGQTDDVLGERVVAFVNAAPGYITDNQVREWCQKRMADYKVPDRVIIADVPLPRNAKGKIQKAELRAMAAQLHDRAQRQQATK